MARRKYTQYLYDRIVEGYREKPGNASHAARIAGCDYRMAQRAWQHGWPPRTWAIPIEELFEKEKIQVRAAREAAMEEKLRVEEEQRAKSYKDAIDAQKQEAVVSQATRINAIGVANMVSRLIAPLTKIAQDLAAEIQAGKHTFTPNQTMKLMSSIAYVVKQGSEASRLALEIERLRVGDPTDIFKVDNSEMDQEQVVEQLMGMHRTLQRAGTRPPDSPNPYLQDDGDGVYPSPESTKH